MHKAPGGSSTGAKVSPEHSDSPGPPALQHDRLRRHAVRRVAAGGPAGVPAAAGPGLAYAGGPRRPLKL